MPDWLLFTLDDGRYAIPLTAVERVVAAAEVTALPGAPGAIRGVVNIAGEVLPLFDLRRRFSLPVREITPADQFLIVLAAGRRAILLVDNASGLLKGTPEALAYTRRALPDAPPVGSVIVSDHGLVFIHDIDAFLSEAESRELDAAMAIGAPHVA